MKGRSIFSAVAVLCLLGVVALVVTAPQSESQGGWLFNRQAEASASASVSARGDGFFPHTRKTVANCEQITAAIKAGIAAAGKEIDKEDARSPTPQAQAASPPPTKTIWQQQCNGGQCTLVPVEVPADNQQVEQPAVSACDEQVYYPVRRGLFGRCR